ncbi:hypothetical protein CRUP_023067 [Coryphaenoides rupestris]|nr:hypothetical protein CRUP_023067 [Coryphaenoides rupestris]
MASLAGAEVRSPGGPQPAGRPPPPPPAAPLRPPPPGPPGSGALLLPGEAVDDAEGLSVAVERCPLCGSARRKLTCSRCVRAGDFVYIDGRNPESVIAAMENTLQADKMKWKIMSCKMKIEQLKEAVAWGNQEVTSGRQGSAPALPGGERASAAPGRASREKRDKMERHTRRLAEVLERSARELQQRLQALAQVRREQVLELTAHVFPTQEEERAASRDPADAAAAVESPEALLTSSTVSALTEARRTTYLSGRWVWEEPSGDTCIRITGPHVSLPSNGDCSAYYSWVEEKSASQGPELEHINPAHTISAALCYATQLANILSHILDINLPKRLCNSEFCGENLSRYRFTRALAKLNTNILHLSFSQHVDSEKLHPHHTLRNIMFLVSPDNKKLGRTGPFEVSVDLEESMEFVEPEASGPAEESADEGVTDEETDLGVDWETVPSPRFCDIPSQPMEMSAALQLSQPAAPGGMISSAAASVTSWFRAYTGQR